MCKKCEEQIEHMIRYINNIIDEDDEKILKLLKQIGELNYEISMLKEK